MASHTNTADVIVIGAGIIGAATAAEIVDRRPDLKVMIVEKEKAAALHQTGRNSGVVHSGIYYRPDSLKAKLCREGHRRTLDYCERENIRHETRGKLLVATDDREAARLDDLEERAVANRVEAERIDAAQLSKIEPAIRGIAALKVPATAIVDYPALTLSLIEKLKTHGAHVRFGCPVVDMEQSGDGWIVHTTTGKLNAGHVVACGGVASDRLARMAGLDTKVRIIPFRGEYYILPPTRNDIVRHLIYPVPDPELPFLGVHLTPMIDGTVTVGPNAVLALARERYGRFDVDLADAVSSLTHPGLWKLLARYPGAVSGEIFSALSRRRYLSLLRKYCPTLAMSDLVTYHAGIRAQAVGPDGTMLDDFLIERAKNATVVMNAPSPAATSAFPIAAHIADAVLGANAAREAEATA